MKKIKAFSLPCILKKPFQAELPEDIEFLSVQTVKGFPALFGITNDLVVSKTVRVFRIFGNEEEIRENNLIYIGTFQVAEGKVQLHLFELPPPTEGLVLPG